MRFILLLSPILLLAGCASAPRAASPDAEARAAIQAQLRRMENAARRGDAEGFVAADSVITLTTPDGRSGTRTRAELVQDQRQRWAQIVETKQIEYVADSLTVRGDTAIVYTRQRWERVVRDAQGQPHTRLTQASHRETWIRRPRGWRTRAVQILSQGPNFTDGKQQ
jgi:hypothetical protein